MTMRERLTGCSGMATNGDRTMTNEELIERLRSVAGFDHLPRTDLAVRAVDALEASEARIAELESKLAARQLSENDREVLAKQLRDIGAVRKVDQDCSCQDCEGAAEWVNAPLSVVLDHFKTNVSDAEPTHLVCAWCPQPARGGAWHNDGKLHPSCGQIDHGQGWVPPYTPRAAAPDAATEEALNHIRVTAKANARWRRLANKTIQEVKAERDAALAAIERARAVCLHLGGVDGDVSQPAPSYYVSVGRNVVATEVLAALDGAPEFEWEYAHREGGKVYDEPSTPLAAAKILNSQPVRRRKAGPWMPVEGEGNA